MCTKNVIPKLAPGFTTLRAELVDTIEATSKHCWQAEWTTQRLQVEARLL